MYAFDYHRPASLEEAKAALKAGGALLAGGQTLIPVMKQRLAQHPALIDLGAIAGLDEIVLSGDRLNIGAMATHAAVAESDVVQKAVPGLASLAEHIGDAHVRNRGTIGGSIANNDPAADYPAGLLALGATIRTSDREIPADDFFTGLFTTALEEDEIITAISIPVPKRFGYAKMANRASRFALVGVGVAETAEGVRAAVTGAGMEGVFRAGALEDALSKDFSAEALAGVSIDPSGLMSDIHADADYRAHLIVAMAKRAVLSAG
ncbi:MAG: carbon monoxide dehydrogenase [Alphaproteobacteria bacterium]|nr:MAG: carbon monoxide dehydrogenase [Alphaproteobacteria bacterium]